MATRVTVGANRFYRIPDHEKLLPSVTTVLSVISKKFVSKWEIGMAVGKFRSRLDERLLTGPREDISKEEMDKWAEEAALAPSVQLGAAGDFGTDAHTLFETLLTSDRPADVPVKPRFRIVVDNFLDWKKTVPSLEVIENEMVVYSLKNEYAGAVDAVCKVEDKLVIMDWKTSNQMHVEYAMQVSAYARAYEEMTGATVQEAWVVRFDKLARKPPQIKVVKDLPQAHESFLAAKKLWTFLQTSTSKHFH